MIMQPHKTRFSPIIEEHSSDCNHDSSPIVETKTSILKSDKFSKDSISIDGESKNIVKDNKLQRLWKFVMPSKLVIISLLCVIFCAQLFVFHRAIQVVTGKEREIHRLQRLKPEEKNILTGEKLESLVHRENLDTRIVIVSVLLLGGHVFGLVAVCNRSFTLVAIYLAGFLILVTIQMSQLLSQYAHMTSLLPEPAPATPSLPTSGSETPAVVLSTPREIFLLTSANIVHLLFFALLTIRLYIEKVRNAHLFFTVIPTRI